MTSNYIYDPARRVINTRDPRLNRVLLREPERCASVSEYAAASGIETTEVIELFGPYLDDETLALEIVGDEIFVLTAPNGRPMGPRCADVAPNLWERLRDNAPVELAYSLWKLVRGLERSGWRVENHPNRIMFGMAQVAERPYLGIDVGNTIVPLVIFPTADSVASPVGVLSEYNRAGAAAVGIVCDQGALDEMVTAARRWVLSHTVLRPTLSVLILEAPRFNPTLLSPGDAAVTPRAVTHQVLQSLEWADRNDTPGSPYGDYVR